jgi:hypothetical protein
MGVSDGTCDMLEVVSEVVGFQLWERWKVG